MSERIAVLDLAEFNQLMVESMQKRYPWFSQATQGREVTADELLARAHRIVRDPSGVLRRTPVEATPPPLASFGSAPGLTSALLQNISDLVARQMELVHNRPAIPRMVVRLPEASVSSISGAPQTRVAESRDLPEQPELPSNDDAASSIRSETVAMDTSEGGDRTAEGDESRADDEAPAPAQPEEGPPQVPAPPTTTPKPARYACHRNQTQITANTVKPKRNVRVCIMKKRAHRKQLPRTIQHQPQLQHRNRPHSRPSKQRANEAAPAEPRRFRAIYNAAPPHSQAQTRMNLRTHVPRHAKANSVTRSSSSSELSGLEEEENSDASCVLVTPSDKTKGKKSGGSRASSKPL